jgi:hypothetical protein
MIITQSGGLNLPDRIAPARRSAIQRRLQLTYTLVLQDRPPNSGLAIKIQAHAVGRARVI